jgi:penicillin-binding protein 1C
LIGLAKWLAKISVTTFVLLLVSLAVLWLMFPFPKELLNKWTVSPSVSDIKARPMISIVGTDDQWRRPVPLNSMSEWLIQATIAVEDERFYQHPGIDPLAVARATIQNITAAKIVSGASTLDMQICRMIDDRPRTLRAKLIESFRSLQLNRFKTKDEILELYLNTAPYGGNIRGVEMASLTYFGRAAKDLSLSEAALIAGLPKSPTRYHPDRHLERAIGRRNTVLSRMRKKGFINEQQYQEAKTSDVVISRHIHSPQAWHASWMALKRRPQGGRTCIDLDIQKDIERLAGEHLDKLPQGSELAIVVIDIEQSRIVSMIGSANPCDPVDGQVNGVLAKRSPGSTLKPFIYATAFEMRRLNSNSIVYDIPIQRGSWSPANFDKTFLGEVTVGHALRCSLNVPAILVAEQIGLTRCCGVIEAVGVRLSSNAQNRSGLSLAVGGAEVNLLDLTNAYATLGRLGMYEKPRLFPDEPRRQSHALNSDVCASINDILSSRKHRPRGSEQFLSENIPWFMWKTGTSSGRRDAWAVGHNHRYAIGVWVGRFRGTGRVAYVGAEAAEPLIADLFNLPRLRTDTNPLPAESIMVHRPLRRPIELNKAPKITSPRNGDTFITINGTTTVRPVANLKDNLTWFLNGKLIDGTIAERLVLAPGYYNLHCIDQAGKSSAVSFTVR